jgi:hypothetical protein
MCRRINPSERSKDIMRIPEQKSSIELIAPDTYPAVLVEMLDLGRPRNIYEGADKGVSLKVQPVFQFDELNSFDERHILHGKKLNMTWGKKGNWLPFLNAVIGSANVEKCLSSGVFDHTMLEGITVLVTVVHVKSGTGAEARTRAEISMVSPLPKGFPKLTAEGYELQRDREGYVAANPLAFDDIFEDVISTAPTFLKFNGEGYQPFGDYAPDAPRLWQKDVPIDECDYWVRSEGIGQPLEAAPPKPKREVDSRATNKAPSSNQYAKDLAAGREPAGLKAAHTPGRQPEPVAVGVGVDDDDDSDPFELE